MAPRRRHGDGFTCTCSRFDHCTKCGRSFTKAGHGSIVKRRCRSKHPSPAGFEWSAALNGWAFRRPRRVRQQRAGASHGPRDLAMVPGGRRSRVGIVTTGVVAVGVVVSDWCPSRGRSRLLAAVGVNAMGRCPRLRAFGYVAGGVQRSLEDPVFRRAAVGLAHENSLTSKTVSSVAAVRKGG